MEVMRSTMGKPWRAYNEEQYASRSSSGRVDNPSTFTLRTRLASERAKRTSQPS
ncbi:hypothetical protein D3C78_1423480 [compost metagenome]